LLEQKDAVPEKVTGLLAGLMENATAREKMQAALAQWHAPKAAEQIAEVILKVVGSKVAVRAGRTLAPTPNPSHDGNGHVDRAAGFHSRHASAAGSSKTAQLAGKPA